MSQLELAIAGNNIEALTHIAQQFNGTLYADERANAKPLPFKALCTVVTDDRTTVENAADAGLYVVLRRTIKAGDAGAVSLLPFVHPQTLTRTEADRHWREQHAPLALQHHCHMTHYTQLSVVATLSGPAYDGIALCGFATADDLRQRFYTSEESVGIIAADVRNFADTKRSPRPLMTGMQQF